MKVRNEPVFLTEFDIAKVEKKYKAKYVMEIPFSNGRESEYGPSLIFYTPKKHPQGSNYFAISRDNASGQYVIRDGLKTVQRTIEGVRADNGDVIYSRFRHDMRTSDDGSVSIDGGPEYTRISVRNGGFANRRVKLTVVDGVLEVTAAVYEKPVLTGA